MLPVPSVDSPEPGMHVWKKFVLIFVNAISPISFLHLTVYYYVVWWYESKDCFIYFQTDHKILFIWEKLIHMNSSDKFIEKNYVSLCGPLHFATFWIFSNFQS